MELVGPPGSSPTPRRGRNRIVDYGFFAALALAGLFFYRTIEAVLVPTLAGAFAAVLARKSCERLGRRLGNRRRQAAALTTLGTVLLVLVPAGFLGWLLVHEAVAAAGKLAVVLSDEGMARLVAGLPLPANLRRALDPADLRRAGDALLALSGGLVPAALQAGSSVLVGAFLFVVSLYYFLVDGARWFGQVERLLPIDRRYLRAFAREFDSVSHALFYGSVLTALVQGLVAGLGYLILGVPEPLLWAAATALVSFTPIVGTSVVCLPLAIGLWMTGSPWRAILLVAWGALFTGSIDNMLRPLLMRGRMRLHPLLVFLSIIGGVGAFGTIGILIGPLAAALFLAAVRIYDRDYRDRLLANRSALPLGAHSSLPASRR